MHTETSRDPRHDPSALATWANAVTAGRVLFSPVLFLVISGTKGSWLALALWFALCTSDGFDGWLARRQGTTRSGAFLDPLADKILVLGAMFTLVRENVFLLTPVAIIATREIVISLYRTVVGTRGVSIPANRAAKLKTLAQQFAVAFALAPITAERYRWTWRTLLWVAVVLTVTTGVHYLAASRRTVRAQLG